MKRWVQIILLFGLYSCSAFALRTHDDPAKAPAQAGRPSGGAQLHVVESTEKVPHFRKKLSDLTPEMDESARNQQIESALNESDWVCGPDGIESPLTEIEETFAKQDSWKASFIKSVEASAKDRFLHYAKFATGDYSKTRRASLVLAEIRANGGTHTKTGVQGFRLLLNDVSAFLSAPHAAIASYFAEAALASGIDLGEDAKSKMQMQITEENQKKRLGALLSLAVSSDPEERALYRQIVLTLPKPFLAEVTEWIQRHRIAVEEPGECTALRLDSLLQKSPHREKALSAPETQALVAKRLTDDRDFPLAEQLKDSEALQNHLLPLLFDLADRKDPRLPEILPVLTPANKAHFDALRPHMPLAVPATELAPLKPTPQLAQKPSRTPLFEIAELADLIAHLEDTRWNCDASSWSSPRERAIEKLVSDVELRGKFLDHSRKLSQHEFSQLLGHYRAGKISTEDFKRQLEGFSQKYYLTDEAFTAREIAIALEMNPGLKRILRAEAETAAEKLGRPWQLIDERKTQLDSPDFLQLYNMGALAEGLEVDRYKKILLGLSPQDRNAHLKWVGGDACDVMEHPNLFKARLHSPNVLTRQWAVASMKKMGQAAVPHLKAALKDPFPTVREAAVESLGAIGPDAKEAAPELLAILASTDFMLHDWAAEALGRMGPVVKESIPALAKALVDPRSARPRITATALSQMGAEAVPYLSEALNHKNLEVGKAAAEALGYVGAAAESAIPLLAAKLKHPDLRDISATALGRIGGKGISHLIAALQNEEDALRETAARALGDAGPAAKEAVPFLMAAMALKDSKFDVRKSATDALGGIGPEAKEAVPALIAGLKDPMLGWPSAHALGKIGPTAKEAIPHLVEVMKKSDFELGAAWALGKMGDEAIPTITELLKSKPASSRLDEPLMRSLGVMGAPAIPLLITTLKESNTDRRRLASNTLATIGQEAVPSLKEALDYPNEEVREFARSALDAIKEKKRKNEGPIGR